MPQTKQFEIIWLPPEQLTPYAKNAKVHSSEQIDKIAGQIAAFGFDQPIVVDQERVIIKGHGRREASLRLGLEKVPVIVTDLDEYQAMAARIADNKVAEAPWDPELLKFDLGTLKMRDFDMGKTGFEAAQIAEFLDPVTSDKMFSERDHRDVSERKDEYENSGLRQIILVMEPERFESLMQQFAAAQTDLGVETNVEVVEKLFEIYAEARSNVG